jgi:hypothetical protein
MAILRIAFQSSPRAVGIQEEITLGFIVLTTFSSHCLQCGG